jgi:hypothetical protein
LLFFTCSARDWAHSLVYAKQMLYNWAIVSVLLFFNTNILVAILMGVMQTNMLCFLTHFSLGLVVQLWASKFSVLLKP